MQDCRFVFSVLGNFFRQKNKIFAAEITVLCKRRY